MIFMNFWFANFIFARLTYFFINCTENSIYKFTTILPTKTFCKLYGFINSNLWRNFRTIAKKQLSQSKSEDIAINSRYLFYWPVWSSFFNDIGEYSFFTDDLI